MSQLADPITIQRKLCQSQDINDIITANQYYYIDPVHPNTKSITIYKQANETRQRQLTKQLKAIYANSGSNNSNTSDGSMSTATIKDRLTLYIECKKLQQEQMVRYLLTDEITVAINSSHIPLDCSKLTKYNQFFNCQDLSANLVMYFYKHNYDAALTHMDKKFGQFWDFVNRYIEGNSGNSNNGVNRVKRRRSRFKVKKKKSQAGSRLIEEDIMKGRIRSIMKMRAGGGFVAEEVNEGMRDEEIVEDDEEEEEDDDDDDDVDEDEDDDYDYEDDEEEEFEEEGEEAGAANNGGLNELSIMKEQLHITEIKHYWRCMFLKLVIHYKLNEFDRLFVEFWNLIMVLKPIKGISAMDVLNNDIEFFNANNIVTRDEIIFMVVVALLVVKPIRELMELIKIDKMIDFIQSFQYEYDNDDSNSSINLMTMIKRQCECLFNESNSILNRLFHDPVFQFHTNDNFDRVLKIIRQKQYILILYSMKQIDCNYMMSLIGGNEDTTVIDHDQLVLEITSLVQVLNISIVYDKRNDVFKLSSLPREEEEEMGVEHEEEEDEEEEEEENGVTLRLLAKSLNGLYAKITDDNKKINEFNEKFGVVQ